MTEHRPRPRAFRLDDQRVALDDERVIVDVEAVEQRRRSEEADEHERKAQVCALRLGRHDDHGGPVDFERVRELAREFLAAVHIHSPASET